jgi:predicted NodU family carbamoyl transferase
VSIGWNFKTGQSSREKRGGENKQPDFMDDRVRKTVFPDVSPARMPKIRWVPHHLSHAASAYYTSGVHDAAVIVVDGTGENQSTSIWRGRDGRLEPLREWLPAQSLGFFYGAAAEWVGLGGHWGAGKLMGLAAYGRSRPGLPVSRKNDGYEIAFDKNRPRTWERPWTRLSPMSFDPDYTAEMNEGFARLFPYKERHGEGVIAYADFAASVQQSLEEAMLGVAEEALRLTGSSVLLLAGGVAMNCSMVGRLVRESGFDQVYVPPVPTDAGISLGSALAVAHETAGDAHPTRLEHAYWSIGLAEEDAATAVQRHGLIACRLDDDVLAERVSAVLASGGIVAWARGRAEIGQRALGARSILADPRDRRNVERLNNLKGREMWRPVAPSVLGEHMEEVMVHPAADPARFMLQAGMLRSGVRSTIPAVAHVDGSARPQSVDRTTNPSYWMLIERFRQLTGVPAVINTSFNLAGEPIVLSAEDAIETFVKAEGLDVLILDDLMVVRSEADRAKMLTSGKRDL